MKLGRSWPWLTVIALWAAAFSLSCMLMSRSARAAREPAVSSVMDALLSGSRGVLGARLYDTADLYFHRGIDHEVETAFDNAIFQSAAEEFSPSDHVHLAGGDIAEMMPWLWLSIQADPGRVETYLVAAFWLSHAAGLHDEALEVLKQGQCAVPFNYEIQLERGRILLHQNKLQAAAAAFDAGLAFWPGTHKTDDGDAKHDKAGLLLYRALLCEAHGKKEDAIAALQEIIELYPHRSHISDRIANLRAGGEPSLTAAIVWQRMIETDAEARAGLTCPHCEDDDH